MTAAEPALWYAPLQPAACAHCGLVHLVPAARLGQRCPACSGALLVAQPAPVRPEPPELALPFRVTPAQAGAALETWARAVWLRPAELNGPLLQQRLTPMYVPMWLVDAEVAGAWSTQAGYAYEVASTNENFQAGQWVTRHVKETRLRWEPRAGRVQRAYANVAAPALEDHARLVQRLGQYPLEAAQPYAPGSLGSAAVRLPSLTPEAAWPFARARLDEQVAADLQAAAGAQKLEQLKLAVHYQRQHWTQLLLPVYATTYQDEAGAWHAVHLNAHTGQIAGTRRASQRLGWQWSAVIAAIAIVLFLLAAALTALGALLPPIIALGGLLMLVSFAVGLAAPLPAVWAWRFNRPSA